MLRRSLGVLAVLAHLVVAAGVSELENALKKALVAKSREKLIRASEALLATGELKAVEAVARYALLCDNHETERMVAGLLAGVPEPLREPVRDQARGNPNYQVRVVLTAVLGAYDDGESFDALCGLVSDPVPSVALAAISRIVAKGDLRGVDALIAELARRQKRGGVVAGDLRQALHVLTGQVYVSAEDWRRWWLPRKSTFTREDARTSRSRGRTSVLGPQFFGHEILSKRILFILDMSHSMHVRDELPADSVGGANAERGTTVERKKQGAPPASRERLERVKRELIKTITELSPDTRFTLMAYNDKIKLYWDKPQLATPRFKSKAVQVVRGFRAEGETWTDTALERAFKMTDEIDTIYLLSDGAPRRENIRLPEAPILKAVKEANRFAKIKIHTVGFRQAGTRMRRFLGALAQMNDGEYKELQ
jgi:hypothetical protein